MNWHNLVIFRLCMATSLEWNKVPFFSSSSSSSFNWKTTQTQTPAPRRRGCTFFFRSSRSLQYFHAYQIKNWPKGGLAAFWRGSLFRKRSTNEKQGTSRKKKNPWPTPFPGKQKRPYVFFYIIIFFFSNWRHYLREKFESPLCITVDLRNVDNTGGGVKNNGFLCCCWRWCNFKVIRLPKKI